MKRMVPPVLVALAALFAWSPSASAQSATFEVQITAPTAGSTEVVVEVVPFNPPRWSLADRAAIEAMWEGLEFHLAPMARYCEMPMKIEIDAESFRGNLVRGTEDGLHPGTRGRFVDLARAMSAVCRRGQTEKSALRSRIHTVRVGFIDGPRDRIRIAGDTLIYQTSGDLNGDGHLGYARFIDWLMEAL